MFNHKLSDFDAITYHTVYEFFVKNIDKLINNGIKKENIIIDLGFGFFKNQDYNYEMLKNLSNFQSLNLPILLGISRKSFFKTVNDNNDIADNKTIALSSAVLDYADILRVHNVKRHKNMINLLNKI